MLPPLMPLRYFDAMLAAYFAADALFSWRRSLYYLRFFRHTRYAAADAIFF